MPLCATCLQKGRLSPSHLQVGYFDNSRRGNVSAVATAPFLAALGTIKGAAVAELVEPASYLGKLYSTTDRQYRPKV